MQQRALDSTGNERVQTRPQGAAQITINVNARLVSPNLPYQCQSHQDRRANVIPSYDPHLLVRTIMIGTYYE